TTTPLYILQGGSNTNTFSMCESYANESVYLSGFGFLTEGNNTNGYYQCTAQGNIAGIGTQDYQPSGLAAYDNGIDNDQSLNAWALYEYERYKNPLQKKLFNMVLVLPFEAPVYQLNNGMMKHTCLK
ncbi:hypothetical protein EBQ93_00440, partial [bacterium]|nr:hypothetical protein [bacterium]